MESLFSRLARINPDTGDRVTEVSVGLEHLLGLGLKDDAILVHHKDKKERVNAELLPYAVALENLRSAFNVGSILRTCENFGAQSVHLIGYTPSGDAKPVQKTALGAENFVDTHKHRTVAELVEHSGRPVIAFETVDGAENFYTAELPPNPIFLFGNERFGISPQTLKACHQVVQIPMQGRKNSMNVASTVAAALGFYCSNHLKNRQQ
jgi:tRNA G18 (ribose-2'-O)-methylase SpoU